jgi:hypothetical protein
MGEKPTRFLALKVLLWAFVIAGCSSKDSVSESAPTIKEVTAGHDGTWSVVQFNGHTYIKHEDWSQGGGGPAITHDPDCVCGEVKNG